MKRSKRKRRKFKRILKKNYKLLQGGSLNYLEECELLAKSQEIYEKLYPQTIELRKMEEKRFKEEEERCEALKKASLVECRKYFPQYLNQVKCFIDSAEYCVLNEKYRGIRDLNKILLKMIDIVEKDVFGVIAYRDFREIPIFVDWFCEYALRELFEREKEIRKQAIRNTTKKSYLPN